MSRNRKQSRRSPRLVATAIASLSIVLAAGGCGFVGASTGDDTLVFAGFGGSMETAMKEEVIPAFEKEHDIDVTYVVGTSDELMAKARAGSSEIDVIWTNDSTHYDGKQEDLFAELDESKVENLEDAYDAAKDPDGIGVATGIQALGLMYNTDVFEKQGWQPPASWGALWDEKYAGHVVGYNFPIGYSNLLLVQAAKMNGGSPENLEPGWKAFERLAPKATAWVSPPAELQAMVADGTGWLAYNGSARAYAGMAAGEPVGFAYPREGAIAYPQFFDVLKTAPNPDLAQEFVDFALSPEAQAGMAEVAMMGPVNRTVELEDSVAETVPYGEEAIEDLQFLDTEQVNENLDEVTARWTRIAGGA